MFKNIIGNERIKRILEKALRRDRLPHSLLFCGPSGVGKVEMAKALAQALVCTGNKSGACGNCDSCRRVVRGNHPDVLNIAPENGVIKIETMRLLKQTAYLKPMQAKKRVFYIVEAEKMNEEAANSLLKILEEPPLFTHVILVTDYPFMIMSTIKSRCQVLNFSPVSKEDIARLLVETGFDKEKANLMALVAGGNVKQAQNLEWEEIAEEKKKVWDIFLSLISKKKLYQLLDEFTSLKKPESKEKISKMMEILSTFCRDFILLKEGGQSSFLMNPEYESQLRDQNNVWTVDRALDCMKKIDYTLSGLQRNQNFRLLMSSFTARFMD